MKKIDLNKLFKFRSHLTSKWITENCNFTATIIRFKKTLKSLHFSGKFSFSYKF